MPLKVIPHTHRHHRTPVLLSFRTGPLSVTLHHRGDEIVVAVAHDTQPDTLFQLVANCDGEVSTYNPQTDDSEEVFP